MRCSLCEKLQMDRAELVDSNHQKLSASSVECNDGARLSSTGDEGSRRDRHSKVITAKGARDRRIRLSVDTAMRLFRVQDVLGFPKPSQAVEWLIRTYEAAIKGFSFFPFQEGQYSPHLGTHPRSMVPNKNKPKQNKPERSRLATVTDRRREKARQRARLRTLNKLKAQASSSSPSSSLPSVPPALQPTLPSVDRENLWAGLRREAAEIVDLNENVDLSELFLSLDKWAANQHEDFCISSFVQQTGSALEEGFCYFPLWL